ncbi:hypothetical protein OZ410_01795 [Robiginitalea sp. M366]|uniref:hypothetical protein n=1 Tax=Robiginitalea aestuariiviva TaxID=3036903 RepID=UPI00240CE6FA|nr:hypothetical protein [Robiginitalea aestuariiviva]MDG1571033.1 hypothetical protein [Robiginitalea aestuariiviva]
MRPNVLYRLLLVCCLLPGLAPAQETAADSVPAYQALADSLAKVNRVHGPYVGFNGETTNQYRNFLQLTETASEGQLLELCNHDNAVVRAYAFWGLARNQFTRLDSLLLAHARDEAPVSEVQGGVITRIPLVDFMQWVVDPNMMDTRSKKLDPAVIRRLAELRFADR